MTLKINPLVRILFFLLFIVLPILGCMVVLTLPSGWMPVGDPPTSDINQSVEFDTRVPDDYRPGYDVDYLNENYEAYP